MTPLEYQIKTMKMVQEGIDKALGLEDPFKTKSYCKKCGEGLRGEEGVSICGSCAGETLMRDEE